MLIILLALLNDLPIMVECGPVPWNMREAPTLASTLGMIETFGMRVIWRNESGEMSIKPQHPTCYLARHGETAWSLSGQHTGLTDLPLTARGERNARRLGDRLDGIAFARVLSSPLQRAARTCALAGFGGAAEIDGDLAEWDYGAYEGKTSAEIHAHRPDWEIFRDGCPQGESVARVTARADRVVANLSAAAGNVLLFSHGHFLRVVTVRWLGLEVSAARVLFLGAAALSILGYHHGRDDPVIRLWNDTRHIVE